MIPVGLSRRRGVDTLRSEESAALYVISLRLCFCRKAEAARRAPFFWGVYSMDKIATAVAQKEEQRNTSSSTNTLTDHSSQPETGKQPIIINMGSAVKGSERRAGIFQRPRY